MTLREIILAATDNHSLDIYLKNYDELDKEVYVQSDEYIKGTNKINFASIDKEDGSLILQVD